MPANRDGIGSLSTTERCSASDFDYSKIPVGYYDRIFRGPKGIRRLWHVTKFERVLDCLPPATALLDVGCFAGTFLSMVPAQRFAVQLGIDVLSEQVRYANAEHGTAFRRFRTATARQLVDEGHTFDAITLIEVIEHLRPAEIRELVRDLHALLRPGGTLVITTPNYASAWPLLELGLRWCSDVTYEEQHLTRFSFPRLEAELEAVAPGVWDRFSCRAKTTTHFLTPFLAAVSYEAARALSRMVPHRAWHHPFGNLILLELRKRG